MEYKMKNVISALAVMGALAFVTPVSAQIVNGNNDVNNPLPEAPIGTKAGGSPASMQAPGEAQAAAGAIKNNADAKNMQPTPNRTVVVGQARKLDSDGDYDNDRDRDMDRDTKEGK